MRASVSAINSPDNTLPNKLVAFDNLEQLLESIDNANNLEPLGLWAPLLEQLDSEEPDLRRMAAWCVGTAVQNNEKAQERLLTHNALPKLITLATSDANEAVRRKAIYALSSAMRNFQPATDEALKTLPEEYVRDERVEAGDMQALDNIINNLREQAQPQSQSRQKGTEVEMSPK
ncbi:hsp70 nucleotide exchange factor fes1 [Acarospora aff. strigata]|nr:hsp70 nucleotide exchange factor fes1 [Acarospora aff. strigata]